MTARELQGTRASPLAGVAFDLIRASAKFLDLGRGSRLRRVLPPGRYVGPILPCDESAKNGHQES